MFMYCQTVELLQVQGARGQDQSKPGGECRHQGSDYVSASWDRMLSRPTVFLRSLMMASAESEIATVFPVVEKRYPDFEGIPATRLWPDGVPYGSCISASETSWLLMCSMAINLRYT